MEKITVATLLDFYTAGALLAMASFLGVLPKQSRNKRDLIELLSRELADPRRIERTIKLLKPVERTLLDEILRRGAKVTTRYLREEMIRANLVDSRAVVEYNEYSANKPDPRREDSRRFEDLLVRLMLFGLVFSADDLEEPDPSVVLKTSFITRFTTVFIPPEIRRYLPKPAPLPPVSEKVPAIQQERAGSARIFQRELFLYWGFVRDKHPGLTAKGELLKKYLKEINSLLLTKETIETGASEMSYPRLVFLRMVLAQLNLVHILDSGVLAQGSDTGFFSFQPDERVKKTLQAWLDHRFALELLLLPEKHRPKLSQIIEIRNFSPVIQARRYILDQVKALTPRGWVRLERLVDQVRNEHYEFFLPRPRRSQYYYAAPHPYDYSTNPMSLTFPGIYQEDAGWENVEANLIRAVVTGPLYWMGLVDLGWGGNPVGIPTAFRLTALGQWLLDLGPLPEIPSEGGKVIVQPNLHIIALDPIQEATLVTLDRFAERLSAERAVEYQLTRKSVYAAQQSGLDVSHIKDILQQHTGDLLPQNVLRTLEEWQAQNERITIRPHIALVHGEPSVLDQLTALPRAGDWIAGRPLPEVAVLTHPRTTAQVSEALRSMGVFPLQLARQELPPDSIKLTAEGEVLFTGRFPSLYLYGHLAQFAEMGETGCRITAASVGRAARRGLMAPEIISQLQMVHAGPLPEPLARRIRAWCKHYGDAALEGVILLQVEDTQILEELLADPEIGPLLSAFKPEPAKALARIHPQALAKLRELLAERGIDILNSLK